jgi:hypothetical protein
MSGNEEAANRIDAIGKRLNGGIGGAKPLDPRAVKSLATELQAIATSLRTNAKPE